MKLITYIGSLSVLSDRGACQLETCHFRVWSNYIVAAHVHYFAERLVFDVSIFAN